MGSIVNTLAVIAGGILGLLLKKGLNESYEKIIMSALGVSVMFIGIAGAMEKMLVITDGAVSSQGAILLSLSMASGALIGEMMKIEDQFERFGGWLKEKAGSKDSRFIEAFVSTSLTICIGAMAIVGSMKDGILHDPSMLYTKAILDLPIVMVFTATMGIGALFSAIPILLLEGGITLLASVLAGVMTDAVIANLSMVGSVLIFCVGINLFCPFHVKVANMLPALITAGILTVIM